jgi:hypothetical protein
LNRSEGFTFAKSEASWQLQLISNRAANAKDCFAIYDSDQAHIVDAKLGLLALLLGIFLSRRITRQDRGWISNRWWRNETGAGIGRRRDVTVIESL